MSSACTLVCPARSYKVAYDAIRGATSSELTIHGSVEIWKRIEVRSAGTLLAFTTLVREKPGDQFSKLILSMHNFFRNVETGPSINKDFVLQFVADAEMLIGVIGEPQFSEEHGHFDCIWSAAELLNGLVFSGEAMLNAQGERLLDRTGENDVTV